MLRITKQTDYGIVLMTFFARDRQQDVHNARDLALRTQLPQPTVTKILKVLAREGLLLSQRGVKGGYQLARDPHSISVADVIRALEGPIAMTQCCEDGPGCERQKACPVSPNWRVLDRAVRHAIETVTLDQMAGRITDKPDDQHGNGQSSDAVHGSDNEALGATHATDP
ncbi:MAG: SUF system Fe-S cluster assembly regulator [Deltaproteobacteria bacterium]|nr:SUF system Fe-S cluster assembly regulator [Deltaproteobacteria bacterium]